MAGQDPYDYDDPYDESDEDYAGDPYNEFDEPIGEGGGDGPQAPDLQGDAPPPLPKPTPQPHLQSGGATPDMTGIHCSVCGYNLRGSAVGGFCPECGSSIEKSLVVNGNRPNPGLAIASMVLGILSIVLFCCCGWVLGIVGLALGIVALMQLPDTPQARSARGMALAGVICSGISIVLGLGWFILSFLSSIP